MIMRNTLIQLLDWLRVKLTKVDDELPVLELLYFDVQGIAESIRNTLIYGEIDFTHTKMSKEDIQELKESTFSYGQSPVLKIGDECIAQSNAILRYTGKLTRAYPQNNIVNAAIVDHWIDLHTEFMFPLSLNMFPTQYGLQWSEEYREKHRQWCMETHIPKYMTVLNDNLKNHEFLGGMNRVSSADFCWCSTLEWLISGQFDGLHKSFFKLLENYDYVNMYIQTVNYEIESDNDIISECDEDEEDDEGEADDQLLDKKEE